MRIARVTETSMSNDALFNLQNSLSTMQDLQDKLSSGLAIRRPSDNPSGTVQAMNFQATQARTQQYARNAQDGIGWLGTADNTLTASLDSVQRVRTLVLQGATATADPQARQALADEISTEKQTLVGLANTSYAGNPIFAGTANPEGQTPPVATYDANGNYNGNAGVINRTVGDNATVQVNIPGTTVFGSGPDSLWNVLNDIQTHLNSTDPTQVNKLSNPSTDSSGNPVLSDLDRLDAARVNIQNRQSEVGARYHRVDTMQSRANDSLITIQGNLSKVKNVDLPATIVQLQLQNTAYQAALSATAKTIQPSLVDFLK